MPGPAVAIGSCSQDRRSDTECSEAPQPALQNGVDRCRGREFSVEKAMIEMYLAGVSVRHVVGTFTQALWGTRFWLRRSAI